MLALVLMVAALLLLVLMFVLLFAILALLLVSWLRPEMVRASKKRESVG